MAKKRIPVICCLFLMVNGSILGFNHPEIQWRSVVTDHFIIHFYDRTEPAVYAAWKIAEQTYASLSSMYDFKGQGKINLALADYDDYSNGFANWTNGSIMIWIADEYFDLRGNTTWLNNVITHELAHIVTLEKQSKHQILDWTLSLNYGSPHATVGLAEPFATIMFWPQWFAEGIAQRESERAGNDGWDFRRDMLLRDAVLFSKPLSLVEMGHFNHNALGNELVYNQGFSFMTFLENRFGREKLRELFNNGRRTTIFAQDFYSYFHEYTGLSIERLYDEWVDSVKTAEQRLLPSTQTAVTVLWNRGFLNTMPKLSRDHRTIGWLTNDRDDYSRTDLIIASFNAMEKNIRIPWAKQSWDFSPDGKSVYYIKSHTPNEQGSYVNDLFVRNLESGRETRIIKNARAYDIVVAPDNSCLAWIRYRDGAFSIVKSSLDGRDRTTVIEGAIGEPFWRLSFNPNDAGKLATTRVKNGKTQVCIVDLDKKTMTPLTDADAQEESPFWADDDRIYYSADYDGISNIYSVSSDGGDCMRHTATPGGLFSPYVVDDSTFIGSDFHNRAFRIVRGALMHDNSFTLPDTSGLSFKPLPRPKGKITIRSIPYTPHLLRRVWELRTDFNLIDPYEKLGDIGNSNASRNLIDSLSFLLTATIVSNQSDALEKRNTWMGLQIAFQGQGLSRDMTHGTSNGSSRALFPLRLAHRLPNFSSKKGTQSPERSAFWDKNTLSSNIQTYEDNRNYFSPQPSASNDSARKATVTPVIIPGIGWQTNEHAVSLGLDVQGALSNAIIPEIIAANGQAQWHILRDLYADFLPQFQIYLSRLFYEQFISTTSLPISLIWSHSGYMNTDISYNRSDLTFIQGAIMPSFFPIIKEIRTLNGLDTVYSKGSSIALEGQCSHGFPLMRYSSLIVAMAASGTWYSEPISDPLDTLYGASSMYTTAGFSAEYVFPIARQINRGNQYADALYGSLIYKLTFYTNSEISKNPFFHALSRASYDVWHYFVEHGIGARATLGLTKSYAFPQMYSLSVLWNVWAKRLNVNISLGF